MRYRILTTTMMAALLGAGCEEEILLPEPVSRVEVTAPAHSLEVGASLQMTGTPRSESGSVLAGRSLAWTSSDTGIASVSPSGLVTAHRAGAVTIRATSEGTTGQAALTVQPQPVAWVQISPAGVELSLEYGSTRQLSATTLAAGAVELSGRLVTWSSSDSAVAAVSAGGMLEARGAGTAVITATSEGKTDQLRVRIYTLVERVGVAPRTVSLLVGEATQLAADLRTSSGVAVDRPVAWTSSDPAVATVDASGRVTALGAGYTTVTAASQTRSATAHVTVGTSWTEQALLGVNGSGLLPAVLYSTTRSVAGVERTVRFQVTEGSMRTLGSRYEILLHGWLRVEGAAAVQGTLVSRGDIYYHFMDGYRMFVRDGSGPNAPAQYREVIHADGTRSLVGRAEPDTPEATLLFRAP